MSEFNTTKQKLRKLWEKIHKNEADLSNLDNEDQLDFLLDTSKKLINKKIVEIHNSDYFNTSEVSVTLGDIPAFMSILDPSPIRTVLTTVKDNKMPINYFYSHTLELTLPEIMLPFIKIVPDVKDIPTHDLTLSSQFTASIIDLVGDNVEIEGDGSLLFEGSPLGISPQNRSQNTLLSNFSTEQLTERKVPSGNTKKSFDVDVFFTRGGEDFRVTGTLTAMEVTFDVGVGCDSQTNQDVYTSLVFEESGINEEEDHLFLSVNSTDFSIQSTLTERRFVNVPPCTLQNTGFAKVIKTDSFANTSQYKLYILGTLTNLTTETNEGVDIVVLVNTGSGDTVTSQTFTASGGRVYYSNLLQGILSVDETGAFPHDYELINFPDTSFGDTLPYTTIKLKRNFPKPNGASGFTNLTIDSEEFITGSRKISHVDAFFRKNNGNFFMPMSGRYLLVTPATKVAPIAPIDDPEQVGSSKAGSRIGRVYDDTYSISGTTYVLSDENHSEEIIPVYIRESTDSQIRIRIFVENPLYWHEDRKYDI